MNQELAKRIEFLLHSVSLRYHTKQDFIPQISSYYGKINLVELLPVLTIGAHQRGNHAHIMLLDKSIDEIKHDFEGPRKIIPLVIFTIKQGEHGYVKLQPGKMDIIYLNKMQKDCFDTFITLQSLVYKT